MCFLVAKLIRRNLFYPPEKVLKLTLSNLEEKKIPGVTPQDPRFRGRAGKRSREEEVGRRGWEGRGEERGSEEGRGWEEERSNWERIHPLCNSSIRQCVH